MVFAIICDNTKNTRQIIGLLWLQGCPAAGRNNFIYACPRNLTDPAARISRGFVCHRTGVDHSHLCHFSRRDDLMPRAAKLTRHGLDFRLVEAAADGIEIYFHDNHSSLRAFGKQSPSSQGDYFVATWFRYARFARYSTSTAPRDDGVP